MVQSTWLGMVWRGAKTFSTVAGIAAVHLAVTACDKTPEPAPKTAGTAAPTGAPSLVGPGNLPQGHPPTSPGGPAGATPPGPSGGPSGQSSLAWEAPAGWETVDHPSSMRMATYRIKGVDGAEDAEMSVMQVGGSLDANIQRWEGQYKDHKGETQRETKKVGGFDVTTVLIQGTLQGGGMPGMPSTDEKTDQAMLAAVVMTPDQPHFFKMTGPAKTVLAARGDFDTMVGTFRAR